MDASSPDTNATLDARRPRSATAYEEARALIPGGVNSPARAFESVGGAPLFTRKAEGAWIEDVDGNAYVDYLCSWGPMLFGHADPDVTDAATSQLRRSPSHGTPTTVETEVARLICDLVPSVEQVRMTNSGTEATMSAARLARGYTGREKIIKFEGHYHGHADFFLIDAGSGPMTFSEPDSPGVTKGTARDTLSARFNDAGHVRDLLEANEGEVACVIVEPVAGNMGCVPPQEGFLEALRDLCDEHGALLIFDEVMTGFRVAAGGAQERYGVTPDLTTLGKIIGGGLPVGAYGGRAEVMEHVSPAGPVYQAGTLSGNPLAMHAGRAMLQKVAREGAALYDRLEDYGARLEAGMRENLEAAGVSHHLARVGAMGGLFFTEDPVTDYASAQACNVERYAAYFHAMLGEGVYLPPSPFEAFFYGTAHGEAELERTLEAQRSALERLPAPSARSSASPNRTWPSA